MTVKPIVGFAGMTHLGCTMALATMEKGFEIRAYSPTGDVQCHEEPGLNPELIPQGSRASLRACDVVFVTLDTPLNDKNEPDLTPVIMLVNEVLVSIREDATLVIMSQVSPGFTRSIPWPKKQLFYQVETLVFGQSLGRALHPERLIVGCDTVYPHRGETPVPLSYQLVLNSFKAPVLLMSYESAELAKIAINVQLVAQLTATNMLAEICEKVGADWYEIIPALQTDKRIGSYLTPGLGIGGGHIERDIHALVRMNTSLPTFSFLHYSEHRKYWYRLAIGRAIQKYSEPKVGILGLAYKPGTSSTVGSAGLDAIKQLRAYPSCSWVVYDPFVDHPDSTDDMITCINGVDILFIATPWPEFKGLLWHEGLKLMRGRVIIDPYRVIDSDEAVRLGFEYHTLGKPSLYPKHEA